ncbi:MAG TPA: Flp family type IVb pilin [Streptosporangiaceae bacterium]|jgi:pilus assembly protein Flp/PilA|nr:Flp family type IVb pilin [Streptosporangiaceae bacterium]
MLKRFVSLQNFVATSLRADRGATAVEYGLLVALIAAVIIGIVATLGTKVADAFSTVSNGM